MSMHPHEPFDREEANAARAYRALPGGEPSEELDARILAAARTIVASSRRHPRPWFMSAGFGAAAAAVLAAGIGWQLGWLGSVPGSVTTPAATQRNEAGAAARQNSAPEEAVERVDIDFIKSEPNAEAPAQKPVVAPAAPPAPEIRRRNAPPPAPPPPAASDDLRDAAPRVLSEPTLSSPAPQPFPAESAASAETDAVLGATAPAGSAREQTSGPRRDAPAAASGAGLAKQIALPPWSEDATLEPEAWLERIRERVRQGDRQGAEFSLQRFVLSHPQRAVPRELQRLLVE